MSPSQRLPTSALLLCALPLATHPLPWGEHGHEVAARAAAEALPGAMPAFFRERADQLVYLNPEPDRWRVDAMPELDAAFDYDHFVNLEQAPPAALRAPHRWAWLRALGEVGIDRPERVGMLPFRIVELHQRLVQEFRLWREAEPDERRWIEDRIVNDAGILGHYVADAANPHHTTIHYDGWADEAPNPEGFSTRRGFHHRFESAFVEGVVTLEEVRERMGPDSSHAVADVRSTVLGYIMEAHAEVETLYRLQQEVGFDPHRPHPRARRFAADRLGAAAEMLRSLWWTAWVESGV